MITVTELLEFLTKVQKLSPSFRHNGFYLHKTDDGYKINLCLDWDGDNDFYDQSIFIDNKGVSRWIEGVDSEFYLMDHIVDEMLVKQQGKEIKAQKRKELIESLTPEQRELLGV